MDTDQLILKEFVMNHSAEAARILEQLKIEQALTLIKNNPVELAVMLFKEMEQYSVIKCIESMEVKYSGKIIEKLPIQLNASILRRLKDDVRESILVEIPSEISFLLKQMLSFPENSIGALMNPQVPFFPENTRVKDSLEKIRKNKQQLVRYIYVIRQGNTFSGIVKLEDLIVADSKEQLSSIMKTDVPHLLADIDFHKILNHPGWIEYTDLPVIDRSSGFLGALNHGEITRLEISKNRKKPEQAVLAGNALGELYRIGLSGLLYSTADRGNEESNIKK